MVISCAFVLVLCLCRICVHAICANLLIRHVIIGFSICSDRPLHHPSATLVINNDMTQNLNKTAIQRTLTIPTQNHETTMFLNQSAPGGTRTHNPRIRSPLLYPVELQGHDIKPYPSRNSNPKHGPPPLSPIELQGANIILNDKDYKILFFINKRTYFVLP